MVFPDTMTIAKKEDVPRLHDDFEGEFNLASIKINPDELYGLHEYQIMQKMLLEDPGRISTKGRTGPYNYWR